MGVREAGKACDRMKHVPDAGVIAECEWRTPAVLGDIISVEHAAALRNHVAFFNTFAAMGGPDQMNGWVLGDLKIAYKDRVHFTDVGYLRWADALSTAVLAEYDRWRRASHLPPSNGLPLPPADPSAAPRSPSQGNP